MMSRELALMPAALFALVSLGFASNPPATPSIVSLNVLNGPVPLNGIAQVAVSNVGSGHVVWTGNPLHVYQANGDQIFPFDFVGAGTTQSLAPGQTTTLLLPLPNGHPGGNGVYLLVFDGSTRAAGRLEIGTPTGLFPRLHLIPGKDARHWTSHGAWFAPGDRWRVANSGLHAATLSSTSELRIRRGPGQPVLASVSLQGLTIPAGRVVDLALPTSWLTPGPYQVEAVWTDPVEGPVVRRHGLGWAGGRVNLHLTAGTTIALGGALPIQLHWSGTNQSNPFYLLAIGMLPGTTSVAGQVLPFDLTDPLFLDSVFTGLGGAMVNGQGVGVPIAGSFAMVSEHLFEARDLWLLTPTDPSLSGVELTLAAAVHESAVPRLLVSQPEVLRLL